MKALILGGADTVWEDVEASEALFGEGWWDVVVAANDVGCWWPDHLDHWCSLHPERFSHPDGWQNPEGEDHGWKALRAENGHPNGYVTWAKNNPRRSRHLVDRMVRPWPGGSTGLLAVRIADEIGCDRAVLCGVPLDSRPHFEESTVHAGKGRWTSADSHWRAWQNNHEKLVGWVRSMSGRTRNALGEPTPEWMEADR